MRTSTVTPRPLVETALCAALCAFLILPLVVPSPVLVGFAINALVVALLSISWNVLGGFGGQMSFGHALLFGTGAYATAILQVRYGWPAPLAAVAAVAAAAGIAAAVGALSFRYGLRGSYFALVTLAFAEVFRVLASSLPVTGGGSGLLVPYRAGAANLQFADRQVTYAIILALVAGAVAVTLAVRRSRFGAYLVAVRENEEAAKALGIDTFRVKLAAMTLSGALGGLAGVAYLQIYLFVDAPLAYGSTMSVEALLGPIIGGAGTVLGPVLGTLLLHGFGEVTKHVAGGAPGVNLVLYGVLLLAALRFLPTGILGLARRLDAALAARRPSGRPARPAPGSARA